MLYIQTVKITIKREERINGKHHIMVFGTTFILKEILNMYRVHMGKIFHSKCIIEL